MHQFVHDHRLVDSGLRNYWGYNSIGFLAPHNDYAARGQEGQQVQEFKQMVKTLHDAGIEVILDVVYNHTAEGNHMGPMLSLKGIDNAAYYRLVDDDRAFYFDYTGTGNSLNMRHPHVLQLIMDSLRYWVIEMHVDGFRFDLAATLARQFHDVDRLSAFFDLIQQDPVVSQVKLIAEPWDVGEGGYQVGNFPPLWSEWNGKYRDTVRDFWRGEDQTLAEFAYRFTGSSDLYESSGRRPSASVNFVTAHDGFTLADLVSYNEKHNEANGEDNNDGESHNRSWNCGAEGPTDDPEILELRARQRRNFLATLLLSQGVPMLLGGDEHGPHPAGQQQRLLPGQRDLLVRLGRRWTGPWWPSPPASSASAATTPSSAAGGGSTAGPSTARTWSTSPGCGPTAPRWRTPTGSRASPSRSRSSSTATRCTPPTASATPSSTTASWWCSTPTTTPSPFTLPPERFASAWVKVVDTADALAEGAQYKAGDGFEVDGRSLVLLRATGSGYRQLAPAQAVEGGGGQAQR